jgi:hypothetical protein
MQCFVIRPFTKTIHRIEGKEIEISEGDWNYIYEHWIKRAIDNYTKTRINCTCSKLVPGNFIKDVMKDLKESEIVIADLTGQRANVFYELGIRHSLSLGTIIITQTIDAVPTDLHPYYCFEYVYTNNTTQYEAYYKEFETKLHAKIEYILENPDRSDSPVADFLDIKHFYSKKIYEKERNEFSNSYQFMKNTIINYYVLLESEIKNKEKRIREVNFISYLYNINILHSLWTIVISNDYKTINEDVCREAIQIFFNNYNEFERIYQIWQSYSNNINVKNIEKFYNIIEKALSRKDENIKLIDKVLEKIQKMDPIV